MKSKATTNRISFFAILFVIAMACNDNKGSISFPKELESPQPVATPLQFTEPIVINWPEARPAKPITKEFDINKLPSRPFDSSGFVSFAKDPEVVPFDWNTLPDTIFNYEKLPSKPLKYEISVLESPQVIKTGLHLKKESPGFIYELGDPLNNKPVLRLMEDRNGFLWIGTSQGLYRYDGESLLAYFGGKFAAKHLIEDHKGQIWITTDNGVYIMNSKAGILKHLTVAGGLTDNWTNKMLIDKQNRVWIGYTQENTYYAGLNIVDEDLKTVKQFGYGQGLQNIGDPRILLDDQNNLWISNLMSGMKIIDLKNGKLKSLSRNSGLLSDTIIRTLQDNKGRVWIADFSGLNVIGSNKKTITHYAEEQGWQKNTWKSSIMNDDFGNIWIATNSNGGAMGIGIKIIDPEKKISKTLNKTIGLNSDDVNFLLKDKQGQVWIATENGLNMLHRNGRIIEHNVAEDVWTIAEDNKARIWFGNNTGIKIIDSVKRSISFLNRSSGLSNDSINNIDLIDGKLIIETRDGINIIDSGYRSIQRLNNKTGSTFKQVETVCKDSRSRFWISCSGGINGIDIFDQAKGTIQHLGAEQGIKDTSVNNIILDRQGNIWFTNQRSSTIGVIDSLGKAVRYLKNELIRSGSYYKPLFEDKAGNIWMGNDKGIFIINANRDSITSITVDEGLIDNNIMSLNQYEDQIYAGTQKGLTIITPAFFSEDQSWGFESIGSGRGINKITGNWKSDIITKDGRFLLGDRGITSFKNGNKHEPEVCITGIDIFNQPQYFSNKPWSFLDAKDTLWGIKKNTFYLAGALPADILFPNKSNIEFDSVKGYYNMPVNLSLPHYQNYFQFHFTQLKGDDTDTTWYSYLLEGVNKKWSDRTYKPVSENYLNLQPGNYTFKVTSLSDGKWTKPVEFSFEIRPPWWKTWWAYSLYVLVLSGIIILIVQYRSRKLKAENLALEEKINQRTAELKQSLQDLKATQTQLIQSEKMASLGELTAGIAHEIQNPLNFVNNFSEVNEELLKELKAEADKGNLGEVQAIANDIAFNSEKINHHGKRADAIVKGMLQHSRTSSGQKELTDINALADEYLRLAYHGLRAKDKSFNASMKTDFDQSIGKISVVPQEIGRVILNLINNAFYAVSEKQKQNLNGYEPTVSVSTKKNNGKVEVGVRDNGNGIPQNVLDKIFQPFFTTKPTGQGTGLGLSLSYDIVKAHGGELKVETKEGQGSEFIIFLPST